LASNLLYFYKRDSNHPVFILTVAHIQADINKLFSNAATSELSAALLSRARSIAKEHEKLRDLLGENFDTKVAKRMGELAPVAQAVKDWDKTHEVGYDKEAWSESS
jgi:hypothetical protein